MQVIEGQYTIALFPWLCLVDYGLVVRPLKEAEAVLKALDKIEVQRVLTGHVCLDHVFRHPMVKLTGNCHHDVGTCVWIEVVNRHFM